MNRVVVLTSRENFVWYSMQEIIPYVESSWQNMNSRDCEVLLFNIDTMSLAELTPKLIGADRLVVTCFNYRMCKVIQYIREILKLNLSFIIHVHNLSTITFWPYRYFTSSEIFIRSDVFITSCLNDKKVLEKVFKDPIIHVIPFFITSAPISKKEVLEKPKNIVYIGRLSPQKNLHNLILGYSFLKKTYGDEIPSLILFGKEDHLGCPNMNIRNDFYLDFLNDLCAKLELSSHVYFKGHVDRVLIDDFLNDKTSIFVSASLHSDENFGMSALQSLITRNRTVLSDWGGHSDFKEHFNQLVTLMPVMLAEFGPALSADTIATCLYQAMTASNQILETEIPKYYLKDYFTEELEGALSHEFNQGPLEYSEISNKVYEAKLDYTTSSTQIFSGFKDPLFLELSKDYIGKETPFSNENFFEYKAVTWMTYADDIFMINDPQKGTHQISNKQQPDSEYTIYINDSMHVKTSKEIFQLLHKNAFINRL